MPSSRTNCSEMSSLRLSNGRAIHQKYMVIALTGLKTLSGTYLKQPLWGLNWKEHMILTYAWEKRKNIIQGKSHTSLVDGETMVLLHSGKMADMVVGMAVQVISMVTLDRSTKVMILAFGMRLTLALKIRRIWFRFLRLKILMERTRRSCQHFQRKDISLNGWWLLQVAIHMQNGAFRFTTGQFKKALQHPSESWGTLQLLTLI